MILIQVLYFGSFGIMAAAQTIQDLLNKRILIKLSKKQRTWLIYTIIVETVMIFAPLMFFRGN